MTIVYAVEPWLTCQNEIKPLLRKHWLEVALNHDDVPLDPAWPKYTEMALANTLHVITMRVNGTLIGYHIAIITPHLHYASTSHMITDVYFVDKPFRSGFVLLRLLRYVEKCARACGVKKLFSATKLHIDMGSVFKRAGYNEVERLYAKIIRD